MLGSSSGQSNGPGPCEYPSFPRTSRWEIISMTPSNVNGLLITPPLLSTVPSTHHTQRQVHPCNSPPLTAEGSEVCRGKWHRPHRPQTEKPRQSPAPRPRSPGSMSSTSHLTRALTQTPQKLQAALSFLCVFFKVLSLGKVTGTVMITFVTCSVLSVLYSTFPPVISCDNQNNTEDSTKQNEYPHFTDREIETQVTQPAREGVLT